MTAEPKWLSHRGVEGLHDALVREHGGLAGLRDEGLLESVLARPQQRWTYEPDADLADLAAAYAFGLAKNHPYLDGNKRIAFVAATVFLLRNGLLLDAPEPEAVVTMLGVAAGELEEAALAAWFRQRTEPRG